MGGYDMRMRFRTRAMIKEAFDNLPSGVGFFNGKGAPILVNRTMHKLVFLLTKRDLQDISELDGIMENPSEVFPGDGTVWRFRKKTIGENGNITEIVAADITELYRRKRELENGNEQQREIMRHLEKISENVVSIARNEEILSMKMRIHNELGYALSATRRFISSELSAEEKRDYIEKQRAMAKMLLEEIGNDDETNVFAELKQSAQKLGMEIVFDGELAAEELMTRAVRECLINAVRHAGGDKVFVKASRADGKYEAIITNNGKPPDGSITEGGGLSLLRAGVAEAGGFMEVKSAPEFSVRIVLPLRDESEETYD